MTTPETSSCVAFGRWAARVALGLSVWGAAACSSCEAEPTRPVPSASASASGARSSAPLLPPVTLGSSEPSRTLAAWPEQTKPLTPSQVTALLPLTEGARVELHDEGLEPRVTRSHQLAAGATQNMTLEIHLAMKVRREGETTIPPVPALTVAVKLETLAVEQGVASVRLTITSASLRAWGEEAIDREVQEQVAPLVAKLPGTNASFSVSQQGLRSHSPSPPADMPEELRQLWASVSETVADAVVTFPSEPIGAGARWTVLDRQHRGGVVMLRKTLMTLLDITDGKLRLSGEVVEAAIDGTAQDPALPKEITMEVLEGVTVGKRRHTVVEGELWPLASSTELSCELVLRVTATAGHFSDQKTSEIKLTEVLNAVRADAAAASDRESPPAP